MHIRNHIAGFAWSLLAVAGAIGCATHRNAVASVAMEQNGSPAVASIAGVWRGEEWEMPVHYLQGVRRITLTIAPDGSWTATAGDTPCASGTASVRAGSSFSAAHGRVPISACPIRSHRKTAA